MLNRRSFFKVFATLVGSAILPAPVASLTAAPGLVEVGEICEEQSGLIHRCGYQVVYTSRLSNGETWHYAILIDIHDIQKSPDAFEKHLAIGRQQAAKTFARIARKIGAAT